MLRAGRVSHLGPGHPLSDTLARFAVPRLKIIPEITAAPQFRKRHVPISGVLDGFKKEEMYDNREK